MKIYTLQHYSKSLIATALTVGLGLASINTAGASVLDSSQSFNDKYSDTFKHDTNADHADFSEVFAFEKISSKGHSTSFASFEGNNCSHGFANFNLFDETYRHSAYFPNPGRPAFSRHFFHSDPNSNNPYHLGHFDAHFNPEPWRHWGDHTTVNPVPEPSEYLLMLCGLGLLGFIGMKHKHGAAVMAA